MNDSTRPAARNQHIFVLRLWRADSPDSFWHASLENPRSGERIGFESLERMFAFLMEQTDTEADTKQGGK